MAGFRYVVIAGAGLMGGILYIDKVGHTVYAVGHTVPAVKSQYPAIVDVPAAIDSKRGVEATKFGLPRFEHIIEKENYLISYNNKNRVANYVLETLTPDHIASGEYVSRLKEFFEDDSIHDYFRSTNSDYKGSVYDKGHLAASCNHKSSQKFLDDTFVLSNIAPQVGKDFNQGHWNKLERHACALVKQYPKVHVCTGPLYKPRDEADDKKFVSYEVIGASNVAVPTHFFKVLLCETENSEYDLEAYVMPNAAIDGKLPLTDFLVSRESIEKAAGFLIFERVQPESLRKVNGRRVRSRRQDSRAPAVSYADNHFRGV